MRSILIALIIISFPINSIYADMIITEPSSIDLLYFWRENCRICHRQDEFLEQVKSLYPTVNIISYKYPDDYSSMQHIAANYDVTIRGLPMTFLGDTHWSGFNEITEEEILKSIEEGTVAESTLIAVPLWGSFDLTKKSLLFSTIVISLVDGFNPCSIWILSLLFALVVSSGSRRKIFMVGITFLAVTSLVYGLFIIGLLNALVVLPFEYLITVLVAFLCFCFALINIKDYLWYGKGASLKIPERYKPWIYKKIRRITSPAQSNLYTLLITASMAFGVVLVELPCTAGFPMLWSGLVMEQGLNLPSMYLFLIVYIIIYLGIELVIFSVAVITLKANRLLERKGRVLKLFGGMVMLGFSMALLLIPDFLKEVQSSLLIVFASIVIGVFIIGIEKVLLSKDVK